MNLTSRMEELAEPMQILLSEQTFELVRDDFILTDAGEREAKDVGTQRVHALEDEVPRGRG